MPTLPNPKHEMFAQVLAEGKSATEAYRSAGFSDNRHNAAALAREQHILTRVATLQATAAERCIVSIESLTHELETARLAAMADPKGAAAAVAAIMGKAKLHGLLVERAVSTTTNYIISDEPMTADEWVNKFVTEH